MQGKGKRRGMQGISNYSLTHVNAQTHAHTDEKECSGKASASAKECMRRKPAAHGTAR